MAGLVGVEEQEYIAVDGGSAMQQAREKLLENFLAVRHLRLRIGAQVMLIKNTDETLVNGSIGKVHSFVDPAEYAKEQAEAISGTSTLGGTGTSTKKAAALGVAKKYPLVDFLMANGSHRRVLVMPETFKIELPNGEVQASRLQVRPLFRPA